MRRAFKATLAAAFVVVVGSPFSAAADGHRERASAWLEAMELPEAAHELRLAGTPVLEVQIAIGALRQSRGEADGERASRRAARILRAEVVDAREHGPMNNFGFFVRTQVESGLRGQELARAVREQRRGPAGAGQPGRPAAAGEAPGQAGRAAAAEEAPGQAAPAAAGRAGSGQAGPARPTAVPGRSGAAGDRATPARRGAADQGAQRQPIGGRSTKQDESRSSGTQRAPSRR